MTEQLQRYLNYLAQDEQNINLLMSICTCYLALREPEQAKIYMQKAQALDPEINWVQQGLLAMHRGELQPAILQFRLALEESDTPLHCFYLSYSLFLNQQYGDALALLKPLDDDSLVEIRLLKARLLHRVDKVQDAITLLEQTSLIHPQSAECKGLLSLFYFDEDLAEKAEYVSKEALALDSKQYEASLVSLSFKVSKNQATASEIQDLLTEHPFDGRLWFLLGNTYLTKHDFTAANEAFQKTAHLWPDFYDNWISLGWCQLFQNKLFDAEASFQKAKTINEDIADSWGGLALVCTLRNNIEEAKKQLTEAYYRQPECFIAKIAEIMLIHRQNPEKAGQQFRDLFPEVSENLSLLLMHSQHGYFEERTLH